MINVVIGGIGYVKYFVCVESVVVEVDCCFCIFDDDVRCCRCDFGYGRFFVEII